MTEILRRAAQQSYFWLWLLGLLLVVIIVVAQTHLWFLTQPFEFAWQVILGSLLLITILFQYVLLFVRHNKMTQQIKPQLAYHRWAGCIATLLFALHAARMGHAWTMILSIIFILTAITGMFHKEVMRYQTRGAYLIWLAVHLILAAALVPLIGLHVWVALSYQGAG
ncbi:MAG: hypothetical protein ABJO67_03955 [Pseudoruegeria sp.]